MSIPEKKARQLMERCVEVMKNSIQEPRADENPSPSVGALLWRPDGTVVEAYRGELRDGDHAEFTLLERKCRDQAVEDGVLFATLEPCLDRNPPKRGCARHIVSARIKQVFVGVGDTNPAVRGQGIAHLQENGVTVQMFDRDLQDEILNANEEFFDWANNLPELEESDLEPASPLEEPVPHFAWDDLSTEALEFFADRAGIDDAIESEAFKTRLKQIKVLDGSENPTGLGALLFGKEPRSVIPEAGLLSRVTTPSGEVYRKEFDMPLILLPNALEDWLKATVPAPMKREGMERTEAQTLPITVIREAVINALVHRDYSITGTKCHLTINEQQIVVKSPGEPVPPLTLLLLQTLSPPLKSRNPILHAVFSKCNLAEEQGFGLETLKDYALEQDLPRPRFQMAGDDLVLTIFRSAQQLDDERGADLDETAREIWEWIFTKDEASVQEVSRALGLAERSARRHVSTLTELGFLVRIGQGPSTRYRAVFMAN